MLDLARQNELRERYQQERPEWQPATEFYAELVRSRLQPDGRVLDLGCGRGGLVEQLEHPLDKMVGVDPDILSLREHRLYGQLPLTAGSSGQLPFVDNSFDIVFASWVLEHVIDPKKVLGEVGRVLRAGGVFVFITPNKRHPLIGLNRLINSFSTLQDRLVRFFYGRETADTFPAYYRINTSTEIRQLAADLGMTLIVSKLIHDPTYLVFRPGWFDAAVWFEERLPPDRAIHLVGMIEKAGE